MLNIFREEAAAQPHSHPAPLPFPYSTAARGHLDGEWAARGQTGSTGQRARQVCGPGLCRCRATRAMHLPRSTPRSHPPGYLICWSRLPTSLLPFYPRCLRSVGTSDRDTAMHCHFHWHQWHSRHEAARPPAQGGLQPSGERVAGPAPARGKPGARHAAKLTAAGCSEGRKG